MPLINWEINLIPTWSKNCFITADPVDSQVPTFLLTDAKLNVPVVTLSPQDGAKLLQKFKPPFKKRIHQNKYQSKVTILIQIQYLD